MKMTWDTLCGRENVATESDTVKMFGGAMCCWNCYSVYQCRRSWFEDYGYTF
jgi:hypothetical protein